MATLDFVDPTTLQPTFIAQQVVCSYPISDLYANSPRYLYYALLTACFVTHWTGWLANVFLGAAATYAGTAAIESFILTANTPYIASAQTVTIPFVSTPLADNLTNIQALVVDKSEIQLRPTALDLDVDPVLAITVTGYLVLLPMQCWSRVAKANRARHILITVWNMMMLAGAISALTLWPSYLFKPKQYKICYRSLPDQTPLTNDGWVSDIWDTDWNTTVWSMFTNFTKTLQLSDNCFYPCFNTTQILRRQINIVSAEYSNISSPRLNWEDLASRSTWISTLPSLIYLAFRLTAASTIYLMILLWVKGITRIPTGNPRLLWAQRKELSYTLWTEIKTGTRILVHLLRYPKKTASDMGYISKSRFLSGCLRCGRFGIDVLTILVLILAMILSPVSIIRFIVWIEWYIAHDGYNGEQPQQVGQWSSSAAIALILLSAVILQLKYIVAPAEEIESEINQTRKHLQKLESLLEAKVEC